MLVLESEIYWLTYKLRQLEAFGLQDTCRYKKILAKVKKLSKKLSKAREFFDQEMQKNTKGYIIKASYDD